MTHNQFPQPFLFFVTFKNHVLYTHSCKEHTSCCKSHKPEPVTNAVVASCPMTAASSGMVFTNFWISSRGRKPHRPSNGVSAVSNKFEGILG